MSGESRLVVLWMVVLFAIVLVPFLLIAIRRATISSSGGKGRRRRPTGESVVDPWSEAGRRLIGDTPTRRLEDTVDLDPFDPEDEPW